jgi:hypothetical protein
VTSGLSPQRLRLDLRQNLPAFETFLCPRRPRNWWLMHSSCCTGHRQKIEDQTKAFPERFGDLRMRGTPSTPSPRGSLSTTSHFSSQAQTPIQGTEEWGLLQAGE